MSWRTTFALAICVLGAGGTGSAIAQDRGAAAGNRNWIALEDAAPPTLGQSPLEQSPGAGIPDLGWSSASANPRWTAAADFLFLQRSGGTSQTLVEHVPGTPTGDRVPGSTTFGHLFSTRGAPGLTGNDFQQGFSGGPRLGLIRHGDTGCDWELSYLQIDGWHSARTIAPNDPDDCLVMRAPGQWISPAATPGGWMGWIQTNQDATQAMAWEYATQLHTAEFNVRWNVSPRATLLAGFRWLRLREDLVGALSPATIATEPPFWSTTTTNNLYGCQIGATGKLVDRGRFSIDGALKAGVYDNNAQQTTVVSVIAKQLRDASASAHHAAFVGETGLRCTYQVTDRLAIHAGYELIWLEGVALAPGQIAETSTTTKVFENAVQALGVNCDSGAFYHGATVGLEFAF